MKHTLLPLLLLLCCVPTSCRFGPNFRGAPEQGLPVTWVNNMPPSGQPEDLTAWWSCFADPQLSTLIARAFTANPDMATAALAIARAETELRTTRADLFPSVSGSISGNNGGEFNTSTSHGHWNGGLSASWTPDIWGGTRRQVEAAAASLGSARAAAAATRVALASSVATTYFEWISAKESLRFAKALTIL